MLIFYLLAKCPKGTFYNTTSNDCSPCPIGQYNEAEDQTRCTQCPMDGTTYESGTDSQDLCIGKSTIIAEELPQCVMK